MAKIHRKGRKPTGRATVPVPIRLPQEYKADLQKVADGRELPLATWLQHVLKDPRVKQIALSTAEDAV
jgi:hypothetical protein